jgi:hypothetical protein
MKEPPLYFKSFVVPTENLEFYELSMQVPHPYNDIKSVS